MDNKYHSMVKSKYDTKRMQAEIEAQRRELALYQNIPELHDVDEKIKRCGLSFSRKVLNGESSPERAAKEIKAEVQNLAAIKQQILIDNGYEQGYLDPLYSCKLCEDTGFVNGKRCSCYSGMLISVLREQSNLGKYIDECWEKFDESLYSDAANAKEYGIDSSPRSNIQKVRKRCEQFIDNFDDPNERNLLMHGRTGTGKTFIAKSIAGALLKKGKSVLYKSAPELFEDVQQHRLKAFQESDFEDLVFDMIYNCDLLIIDDLGTESATPARSTELLNLLNTRENNSKAGICKTIISTNISPARLFDYYNERIASRIIGNFDTMTIAGADIRIIKVINRSC
ncbi:MAG: ATP-binding protein [Eubacteriales bacterium]|nr:ATP-binding protein [Eubacteriales bacterium]